MMPTVAPDSAVLDAGQVAAIDAMALEDAAYMETPWVYDRPFCNAISHHAMACGIPEVNLSTCNMSARCLDQCTLEANCTELLALNMDGVISGSLVECFAQCLDQTMVGDWIRCATPDCAALEDFGLRFHSVGTYDRLEAVPGPASDAPICVTQGERGRYDFDRDWLTFYGFGDVYSVTIDGDIASLTVIYNKSGSAFDQQFLRIETYDDGSCFP